MAARFASCWVVRLKGDVGFFGSIVMCCEYQNAAVENKERTVSSNIPTLSIIFVAVYS
jgi:hypothetical protein